MDNLRNFTIFSYFMLTFLSLCATNNKDINSLELSLAGIAHECFADVLKADNDSGKDASELYAQIMGDEIELKLTDYVASDLEGKMSPSSFASTSKSSDGLDDDVMRVVRSLSREREDDRAFLGTNLFSGHRKPCFSKTDIALLQMRRDFELVIPKGFPKHLLTDKKICALMKYFGRVNDLLEKIRNDDIQFDAQRAFYDTLGAYLRYRVVPVAKISFYAGQMRLCTVDRLIHLYNECRLSLNTNGNGWKVPRRDLIERLRVGEVEPIRPIVYKTAEPNACTLLDLQSVIREADNVGMLVGLPKLEPEDEDGFVLNIALPFKKRRIYNIRSSQSAFIVVRFYLVVTRCYEVSGICQNMYNERFKVWIDEEVEPHFYDEKFYPGLGGILRIYETLAAPFATANAPDYISAIQEKGGNPLDPTNSDMPALVINDGDNDMKGIPSAEKDSILEQSIGLLPLESDSDSDSDTDFDSDSDSDSISELDSESHDSLNINNRTRKRDSLQKRPGQKSRNNQRNNEDILTKSTQQWTHNSTKPHKFLSRWPWNKANNKSRSKINLIKEKEKEDNFWDCWFNPNKYILYTCFLLLALLVLLFLITVYNLYGVMGCDMDKMCLEKNQGRQTPETGESQEEEKRKKLEKQKEREDPGKQPDDLRKTEEGCCSRVFGTKGNQSRTNARHKKTDEVIVITSSSQSVQPTKETEEHPRKHKRKPRVRSSSRHRSKSKERKRRQRSKHHSASSTNSEAKPQDEAPPPPQKPTPPPPPPKKSPPPASTSASESASASAYASASVASSKQTSDSCLCVHFEKISECPICAAHQRKKSGHDIFY